MNQSMVDLSQLNLEEMIREYREEEAVRLMNIIIENGKNILELQKILVTLEEKQENQRRRQEDRKQRRREYEEGQEKEEQRKEKKEKKKRRRKGQTMSRVEQRR